MSPTEQRSTCAHVGRELDLMLAGLKPLSMFIEPIPPEFEYFPEKDFDTMVENGRLVKRVSIERTKAPNGTEVLSRRVLYALPHEAWRIDAMLLIQDLYVSLLPSWRPDLERVIGLLLGYVREDTEHFLNSMGL